MGSSHVHFRFTKVQLSVRRDNHGMWVFIYPNYGMEGGCL